MSSLLSRRMLPVVLLMIAIGALTLAVRPDSLVAIIPLILIWVISPFIIERLSQPIQRQPPVLSETQQRELRRLARQTWLFFEDFVGPEDHWLPPDHYQQSPRGVIAHQTSPTNIGLMLISTLGAYDLGYIGLLELGVRTRDAFEAVEKLERYRGHLLNWYDTRTLAPLPPRYVSTVDSGNWAACLLALQHGLREIDGEAVVRPERWTALLDTLDLVADSLGQWQVADRKELWKSLLDTLEQTKQRIQMTAGQPEQWVPELNRLAVKTWPDFAERLAAFLEAEIPDQNIALISNLRVFIAHTSTQINSLQRDIETLLPWLSLLGAVPSALTSGTDDEVRTHWQAVLAALGSIPYLGDAPDIYGRAQAEIHALQITLKQTGKGAAPVQEWCSRLEQAVNAAHDATAAMRIGLSELAGHAESEFQRLDFGFLCDPVRCLFHIGYNVDAERLDNSYYDLLASEARLASLIAISTGQIPQEHWLHLGRPITQVDGTPVLMSWSGTMFEYLMPSLLVRSYDGTLLDQSLWAALRSQMDYARARAIPWGISESGYYGFDGQLNYQYRAFGVPDLAFKRGLADDLVVSPYASLLATAVDPLAVLDNIERMKQVDLLDIYGFYESVDFTQKRLHLGHGRAIVREYMAHHQGMIFLALVNFLRDQAMIRRFHTDLRIQSVELLLQEQIPFGAPLEQPRRSEVSPTLAHKPEAVAASWKVEPDAPVPQVHFLSNGTYGTLITAAGGGYSQWKDFALTRWRADTTLDDSGMWVYVQDADSRTVWSAASQPSGALYESQEVLFFPYQAVFKRRVHDISVQMEITIPPDEDVEVRRITLINHSGHARRLVVTNYGEVVLAPQEADRRHPAFSKLFVESEYLPEVSGLAFRRRPRADDEITPHIIHLLAAEPGVRHSVSYTSDRAEFIGRGRTLRDPRIFEGDSLLSGAVGSTLDPIMALQAEIELEAHERAQIAYVTVAAETRAVAQTLARAYQQWATIEYAFERSRYQSELEMRQLSLDSGQLERIQRLLGALLYPNSRLRPSPEVLKANINAQPALWAYGISGDYPILLAHVRDEAELGIVQELLQAHAYWRSRNIKITFVILTERDTGYTQELTKQVRRLVERSGSETWINRHDGIFILRADQITPADLNLLKAAARVYLKGEAGALADQLPPLIPPIYLPLFVPTGIDEEMPLLEPVQRPVNLVFDNGLGGFCPDCGEYVIFLEQDQMTPAPWINVIANPDAGFIVSEAGGGYSWAANSGENRLTSWRNDPVSDLPAEVIYLRDEETAIVWSPTPLPAGDHEPYLVRHGAGYTVFAHHSQGLKQQVHFYGPLDAPVKIVRLRLENVWRHTRRITATYYTEWTLGTHRDITQQYIIPEYDQENQIMLARNPYSIEFGEQVAFSAASVPLHGLTADRTEFLGRNGSYQHPAGLKRIGLGSRIEPGVDPCSALQVHLDLGPGEAEEIIFVLGQSENRDTAVQLAMRYRQPDQADTAWQQMRDFWKGTLESIEIKTPDVALNTILPWLLYQTLSCRLWGRSALYQSGGAFGFRDQLQDVMALIHTDPELTREHLLRATAHQFEAGDVLHWWHPPSGRGVRTRFSDDLLWLPYVTAHYVTVTRDESVLDERIPFLKGDPLKRDEDERYEFYQQAEVEASLYDHCLRALEKGFTQGRHGLPLMGTGDWNDGMNRVGVEGHGESVWVAWFLMRVMQDFIPLCERRGDTAQAHLYRTRVDTLRQAVEETAWDGSWYRRAYYDDGMPLGSSSNTECKIDSIAQSWAVLAGIANPARARQAMASVMEQLVQEENRLILLFAPPFDKTPHDPGYIKGYPPGVRENGGQYTHAALWTAWAFAEMGQNEILDKLLKLLNPILHTDTPDKLQTYKVEPYVVAADVYSVAPHIGRGGWTWYSGSSAWMYRLIVEAVLGLRREGDRLIVNPCIPSGWSGFEASYRYKTSTYQICVTNEGQGPRPLRLDGTPLANGSIPLINDGKHHQVDIHLGHSVTPPDAP